MWASPLLADVERRDRKRALRKRTFRVIVVVIAGIFVAGLLYSPAPTPTNIARSSTVPGPARRIAEGMNQFADSNFVTPLGPPCRLMPATKL